MAAAINLGATLISISEFPFPPSENQIFAIIKLHGVLRKIKSKKYSQYSKDCAAWTFKNHDNVISAIDGIGHTQRLALYGYFYSPDKWYTKKGAVKKADVANYLKASIDELCKILKVDDSAFFSVACVKIVNTANDRSYVNFVIKDYDK